MTAILGRKGQMTQLVDDRGRVVPVTPIEVGADCVVVGKRTKSRDGYSAVQLGWGRANPRRLRRPIKGFFARAEVEPTRVVREVRMEDADEYTVGKRVSVDLFESGDAVHVMGRTKGRGFAGGVRRWGWSSGPRSHGSMSHRRIGSVGAGSSPGRVLRGRTLPGQYGGERVTIRNLTVVRVEPDAGVLYVKGSIPGSRGGLVLVRRRLS